jgi:hypothetical protein
MAIRGGRHRRVPIIQLSHAVNMMHPLGMMKQGVNFERIVSMIRHRVSYPSKKGFLMLRRTSILIFLLSMTAHGQQDLLRSALKSFGLDSSNVGYRPQPAWGNVDRGDPFRLQYFDGLLARPLKIPNFTREMLWRYNLWITGDSSNFPTPKSAQVRRLAGLVINSARNLGYDVGRYGLDYEPAIDLRAPMTAAIRSMYENAGRTLGSNIVYPLPTQDWSDIESSIDRQARSLAPELQRAVASILVALQEAARWRDDALRRIPRDTWQHIFTSTTLEESQCDAHTFDQTVYDAVLAFDGSSMHYGASLLAQAVEKALPQLRRFTGSDVSFDVQTPLGRVLLTGRNTNIHYAQDCALLIDFAGDDVYYGAVGSTGPALPVSVAIDLDGDDRYVNEHAGLPSQGAGVLGIGMLIDCQGKDSYASRTFSQGCGRFGVGILCDEEGNDRYATQGFSQGAGMYGSGILLDMKGDDTYNTVYYAQGYGFSLGLGLLADVSGNDRYIADDTNLNHVGDETPKHNESDAQGFGAGRRGDHTDGHNMSGGLGILHDMAGDDEYFAGVFAQGSGYWYGYGILNDMTGNDRYRGVFFNLGAAAHFAIGVLLDQSGDDRTDLVMTLGLGTAHDASAAFYIDSDGNDTYTMSEADDRACSLGTALNNSFAVFANIRGNDTYTPVGNALGYATSRHGGDWAIYAPATGLFFDIGGNDTYNFKLGKDGTRWNSVAPGANTGVSTLGVDADEGMIRFEQ